MSETTTARPSALTMRRIFHAPRARVFDAWTDPEMMRRWLAPREVHVAQAVADARVGGEYEITMEWPDGERMLVCGRYVEISRPERLVMTWEWESEELAARCETLITLEFHERGDETEMVLTHDRFTDEAMRGRHEHGWTGCFEKLDDAFRN